MTTRTHALQVTIVLATLVAGCATPPEVRELAEKTAANVGTLRAQVELLNQESRNLAEIRAANVAQLHAANSLAQADYNYDIALTKKSGNASTLALIDLITAWGEEVAAIYEAADESYKERHAEVLAAHASLDTNSTQLAGIATSLAALAEEENRADRLQFLAGFARSLKSEIDDQLEQGGASATRAKRLLDDLKSSNN